MNDELTHNPKNAVTESIVREAFQGRPAVKKVLTKVNRPDTPAEWRASEELDHWNYWRREAEVYLSELPKLIGDTALRLPELLHFAETDEQITLWLEDVHGRTGAQLSIDDYERICHAWGSAQNKILPLLEHEWCSAQFIRRYGESKPVDYGLLEDDGAWQQPLIANNWDEQVLRPGLIKLHKQRQQLLEILAQTETLPCHLDFWPNNLVVTDDSVVLLDWSFFGTGAPAEDVGNFIPDAVFDGFVASQQLPELEEKLVAAYLKGRNETMDPSTLYATAVKYVWLGPLLLARASEVEQTIYGGALVTDANAQYFHRGKALQYLCQWVDRVLG